MEKLRFIPQLNAFRFLAVVLVMITHWAPNNIINVVPNGFLGVSFFFVLSGFLISTNLIYIKQAIDRKDIHIGHGLKVFYIKRSLRIFPLYYLIILLVFVLNRQVFMGHIAWYLTYTPNFLIFREQNWQGFLSHFWSLGVEEQFYLIWPLLIFVTPSRWLKHLFLGLIGASILFKFFAFRSETGYVPLAYTLPVSCFDAFGLGALLSYFLVISPDRLRWIRFDRLFLIFSGIGVLLFCSGRLSFLFGTVVDCASLCLIALATTKGFSGIAGTVLNAKPVNYLGKISYGLYGFHNFMPWLWRCMTGTETKYPVSYLAILHNPWLEKPVVALAAQFILLLIIASTSWFLIERPLNDLKNHLE